MRAKRRSYLWIGALAVQSGLIFNAHAQQQGASTAPPKDSKNPEQIETILAGSPALPSGL